MLLLIPKHICELDYKLRDFNELAKFAGNFGVNSTAGVEAQFFSPGRPPLYPKCADR